MGDGRRAPSAERRAQHPSRPAGQHRAAADIWHLGAGRRRAPESAAAAARSRSAAELLGSASRCAVTFLEFKCPVPSAQCCTAMHHVPCVRMPRSGFWSPPSKWTGRGKLRVAIAWRRSKADVTFTSCPPCQSSKECHRRCSACASSPFQP
jgi:hypothetical protein